jgi:hypothetical protein
MVCVTTSVTLLNSVLAKAGESTISEYKRRSYSKEPVVLSGGLTLAKGILFVPWKLEVESSDSRRAQQVHHLILLKINPMIAVFSFSRYHI